MTKRLTDRTPAAPAQRRETQDQYELAGRVWKAGEVVRVDGWAGNYTVKCFDGDVVEMVGGPRNHFRACRVERLREMGAATKPRKPSTTRQTSWIRDAIVKDGRVEVPIPDDADAYGLRLLKNLVFHQAYALGLKGKFKLTVDKKRGVLVGERKEET